MNIHIEFCIQWNYGPEFDRVSNIIQNVVPEAVVKGNDKTPRTGAFEITYNDKLLFSKFETNRFPKDNEIIEFIDLIRKDLNR